VGKTGVMGNFRVCVDSAGVMGMVLHDGLILRGVGVNLPQELKQGSFPRLYQYLISSSSLVEFSRWKKEMQVLRLAA
jgi:hypothetical protein